MQNDEKKTESARAQKPNAGTTAKSPAEGQNNLAHSASCGNENTQPIPKSKADVAVRLGRPRPSQIMHRMNRLMHLRWLEKIRPSKTNRV